MPTLENIETTLISDVVNNFIANEFDAYESQYSLETLKNSINKTIDDSCIMTKSAFSVLFDEYESLLSKPVDEYKDTKEFRALVKLLVPGMRMSGMLAYITKPFGTIPIFNTDGLIDMMSNPSIILNEKYDKDEIARYAKLKSRTYLLKKYYGMDNLQGHLFRLHFIDTANNLSRFFQVRINNDYVNVKFKGKKPQLEHREIIHLTENLLDDDLWDIYFPKDSLYFSGFSMYTWEDVTELESLNRLSLYVKETNFENDPDKCYREITQMIRDYFHNSEIDFGSVSFNENEMMMDPENSFSLGGLKQTYIRDNWGSPNFTNVKAAIDSGKKVVSLHDLSLHQESEYESSFLQQGYRCVVLAPILVKGKLEVLMEFACKEAVFFDHQMLDKVQRITYEMEKEYQNFIDIYKNKLAAVIQEEFTAIHPSVQWKFEEVVKKQLSRSSFVDAHELEPIVFDNLIPLYGQSDIIGSNHIRSEAVRRDLLKNMKAAHHLMSQWQVELNFIVMDEFISKVEDAISKLQVEFNSSDESSLIHLLTDEIHPYLKEIELRHHPGDKTYKEYLELLDPDLNIIYDQRKKFEESVSRLNMSISEFLDEEESKMQKVLPHYFEKYKTDGVEYNLYIGDSILREGSFNQFDIKEFKIWQLINMCKIVRMVDSVSPQLATPLHTAQLIFVYNTPLSIRFRLDEKQFDVDGTYNVRYEILKKRVDKAHIKGSRERLTTTGKIAIVYLSDADKTEYLKHLQHLKNKGYIEDNIEELDLEDLQGIQGLRALRITVKKEMQD